jgi:misacylated tRNA(Ala) deacylase
MAFATEALFRDNAYLKSAEATVIAVDERGIFLDRTVFYATSGGQPGDTGTLLRADGSRIAIAGTVTGETKDEIVHKPGEGAALPEIGETVTAEIDWDRRMRLMRMHAACHLLSIVCPYPITGAAVGEDKGRVDFNLPEVPDAAEVEAQLNELVARDLPVTTEWITDEELAANPGLVKSMNVKPPMGMGRVRLVRIGDVDLQPCGGTHVRSTGEIGRLKIGKIEKKGAINRRISVLFAD